MKRIYFVYEPDERSGVMVAAESHNQAKLRGHYEICCDYIDARALLIKGGQQYYDDIESKKTGINIIGKTYVEADDSLSLFDWEEFKVYLLKNNRGKLFKYDDDENEIEVAWNE
jgi:hypothetical protein